ncbi:MAG: cupin domain-containing protein [Bryobacteraceae bacterium]|nr:cupin domain-containing protein [Bryobacteraceae bacterium]
MLSALALVALAQDLVWTPKPAPDPYTGPHKPHTKLAELKAKHAGQTDWHETIVDDDLLKSVYIQMKPGAKTPRILRPDTRSWWVVVEGQVKFEIEGTAPFVAKKNAIVQAPMQTFFSYEAVGDAPALIFETNIAKATTVYANEADVPNSAKNYMKTRLTARIPGKYLRNNKPLTTFEEVAEGLEKGALKGTQKIVEDDRGAANFIYGYEKNLAPIRAGERGHYHAETAEYWLILAGQIRYLIEGVGVIIANPGDVVYVPRNRFHMPRWYGPTASCRLAFNGYPNLAHFFDPEPAH